MALPSRLYRRDPNLAVLNIVGIFSSLLIVDSCLILVSLASSLLHLFLRQFRCTMRDTRHNITIFRHTFLSSNMFFLNSLLFFFLFFSISFLWIAKYFFVLNFHFSLYVHVSILNEFYFFSLFVRRVDDMTPYISNQKKTKQNSNLIHFLHWEGWV